MDEKIVVWSDAFSVGLSAIDDQHKKLVDMINDLIKLHQDGSTPEKVAFARTFQKAGDYAQTHFHDEEEILKKTNYPDLPEHIKKHASFMTDLWKIFMSYKEGNESTAGLVRFLKNWLLDHIAKTDKQYAPYLAK
jgi:hemerythrin-like metal-binding protein